MPPAIEQTPYTPHPLASLIAFVMMLVCTLIAWQVCRYKDGQMRGKRKRGGEYSSGGNVNILSEMEPWRQSMWLFGILTLVAYVLMMFNDTPVMIIQWFHHD